MNKTDLVKAIAEKSGVSQTVAAGEVKAAVEVIVDTLAKGENVTIPGFGTFKVNKRAARTARNPRTGKTIQVPASKSVSFKVSKTVKDKIR